MPCSYYSSKQILCCTISKHNVHSSENHSAGTNQNKVLAVISQHYFRSESSSYSYPSKTISFRAVISKHKEFHYREESCSYHENKSLTCDLEAQCYGKVTEENHAATMRTSHLQLWLILRHNFTVKNMKQGYPCIAVCLIVCTKCKRKKYMLMSLHRKWWKRFSPLFVLSVEHSGNPELPPRKTHWD
jgi:hypothetical protein